MSQKDDNEKKIKSSDLAHKKEFKPMRESIAQMEASDLARKRKYELMREKDIKSWESIAQMEASDLARKREYELMMERANQIFSELDNSTLKHT